MARVEAKGCCKDVTGKRRGRRTWKIPSESPITTFFLIIPETAIQVINLGNTGFQLHAESSIIKPRLNRVVLCFAHGSCLDLGKQCIPWISLARQIDSFQQCQSGRDLHLFFVKIGVLQDRGIGSSRTPGVLDGEKMAPRLETNIFTFGMGVFHQLRVTLGMVTVRMAK